MSARVLTLFGEEIIPEQLIAVGKSRAPQKTKQEETKKESKRKTEKTDVANTPVTPVKIDVDSEDDILEGWDSEKQYYSIGEVARLFKVKTSNIRFWTNEFAMKVRTTRKGDRLYTPSQVREMRTIYHLVKEKKYTISGAKERLKTQKKISENTLDLRDSLLQLRNKLLTIRNQLT